MALRDADMHKRGSAQGSWPPKREENRCAIYFSSASAISTKVDKMQEMKVIHRNVYIFNRNYEGFPYKIRNCVYFEGFPRLRGFPHALKKSTRRGFSAQSPLPRSGRSELRDIRSGALRIGAGCSGWLRRARCGFRAGRGCAYLASGES